MNIEFTLNGLQHKVTITSVERAIDVLIKQCGIKSLAAECLDGHCGKCLILLDGKSAYSCIMPAFLLRDRRVETIEHFTKRHEFDLLVAELHRYSSQSCSGYHSAIALMGMMLLQKTKVPQTDEILDAMENTHCNCLDPADFVAAVLNAYQKLRTTRKQYEPE